MLVLIFEGVDCASALGHVAQRLGLAVGEAHAEGNGLLAFIDRQGRDFCVVSLSRVEYWDDDRAVFDAERSLKEFDAASSLKLLGSLLDVEGVAAALVTATPSVRLAKSSLLGLNYSVMECLKGEAERWKCLCAAWLRNEEALALAAKVAPSLFAPNAAALLDLPSPRLTIDQMCNRYACSRLGGGIVIAFSKECADAASKLSF